MARTVRFDPEAETTTIRLMAQKLSQDIQALVRVKKRGTLRTVPEFRTVCSQHDNIHALVVTIQEHAALIPERLPEGFRDWTMRARLRGLTVFAEIARDFVKNPPLALTQSLTARDVLTGLRATFDDSQKFFNNVLMEYALDDKTTGELDRAAELIEEIITIVDGMVGRSSNYLPEF